VWRLFIALTCGRIIFSRFFGEDFGSIEIMMSTALGPWLGMFSAGYAIFSSSLGLQKKKNQIDAEHCTCATMFPQSEHIVTREKGGMF
jgi:hypothetical protein